jgi:hypothetical protein
MTVKHGKKTRIFLAEFDFSGEGRSLDLNADVDQASADTFLSDAKEYVEGAVGFKIDHKGVFTDVDDNWDEWLETVRASATNKGISVMPANPSEGDVGYNGVVKQMSVKRPVKIDDIVGIEASYQIDGPMGRGIAVGLQLTAKGSHQGTGYNIGAAEATEMWLITIHVIEVNLNGGSGYTVKLQESSDDGDTDPYADVSGATTGALSEKGSVVKTIDGAREAWVRVIGTPSGGAETAKFAVVVSKVSKQ